MQQVATREIEEALAANDIDLARSFIDLAAERAVAGAAGADRKNRTGRTGCRHAFQQGCKLRAGFFTGKPEDVSIDRRA